LELEGAYIRRQKWLARLRAVEIVNALGEALGGKGKNARPVRETSLEGLMSQMGATWQ